MLNWTRNFQYHTHMPVRTRVFVSMCACVCTCESVKFKANIHSMQTDTNIVRLNIPPRLGISFIWLTKEVTRISYFVSQNCILFLKKIPNSRSLFRSETWKNVVCRRCLLVSPNWFQKLPSRISNWNLLQPTSARQGFDYPDGKFKASLHWGPRCSFRGENNHQKEKKYNICNVSLKKTSQPFFVV